MAGLIEAKECNSVLLLHQLNLASCDKPNNTGSRSRKKSQLDVNIMMAPSQFWSQTDRARQIIDIFCAAIAQWQFLHQMVSWFGWSNERSEYDAWFKCVGVRKSTVNVNIATERNSFAKITVHDMLSCRRYVNSMSTKELKKISLRQGRFSMMHY